MSPVIKVPSNSWILGIIDLEHSICPTARAKSNEIIKLKNSGKSVAALSNMP